MKSKILLIICLVLLVSCADKASDKKNDELIISQTDAKEDKKTASSEKIKNCEDFIDTYESWSNELLELMEKYEGNPVGLATSSEYITTMGKGVDFIQSWENIAVSCAMNPSYETRMKAIQENMEKRRKELGF